MIICRDFCDWTSPRRCTQWHTACLIGEGLSPLRSARSHGEPYLSFPIIDPEKPIVASRTLTPDRGPRVTETVAEILAAHRAGTLSPAQTVARSYRRIRERDDPAIFISLRDEKEAVAEAERLAANKDAAQLPLFGIPIAVKDNYRRRRPAHHVGLPGLRLYAGARCDRGDAAARGRRHRDRQGQSRPVRYRPCRRPLALRHPQKSAAGGSDSGRLEFGLGGRGIDRLVPLALGTDTAGSGRVPAMLNNIVGLKPSLGLVSTRGAGAGVPDAGLRVGILAHR